MKLEDTIRGFDEILEGKHDDLPEQAFYMVGPIEGAVEKGRKLAGEEHARARGRARSGGRAGARARHCLMADKTFSVSLVTPDGAAFEGEAVMLIVPGADGEIGVLARHAPLIATLKAGSTRVHLGEGDDRVREFATGPGFFKVEQDRAIALVDDAILANEIDVERARQQLEEAQAELETIERGESEADRWQLEQRIRHAENQLTTAGTA